MTIQEALIKKWAGILASLLVFSSIAAGPGSTPASAAAAPVTAWKADCPDQLAKPVDVSGYTVSPPTGYTMSHDHQKNKTDSYSWMGAQRPDGLSPNFLVEIAPYTDAMSPREMVEDYIHSLKSSGLTNIVRGRPEHGTIDGIPFTRIYWTAASTINKHKYALQGFVYAGKHDGTVILMCSQDVEPYQSEALKVAECAALSLHIAHDSPK